MPTVIHLPEGSSVRPARGRLPGAMLAFHGTSEKRAESIRRHGLRPDRLGRVWITPYVEMAWLFGWFRCTADHGLPWLRGTAYNLRRCACLTLEIETTGIFSDPEAPSAQWMIERGVLPHALRRVEVRPVGDVAGELERDREERQRREDGDDDLDDPLTDLER